MTLRDLLARWLFEHFTDEEAGPWVEASEWTREWWTANLADPLLVALAAERAEMRMADERHEVEAERDEWQARAETAEAERDALKRANTAAAAHNGEMADLLDKRTRERDALRAALAGIVAAVERTADREYVITANMETLAPGGEIRRRFSNDVLRDAISAARALLSPGTPEPTEG